MAINDVNDPHLQLVTTDPQDLDRLQAICRTTFTETFGDDNDPADLEQFLAEAYSIQHNLLMNLNQQLARLISIMLMAKLLVI